jgi:hypothetical protein
MRRLIRLPPALIASLAATALLPAAAPAKPTKPKKPFTLNLCKIAGGAVSSAQVTAPCHQLAKITEPGKPTPIGRAPTLVLYGARWGTVGSTAHPQHYAEVRVGHLLGKGETLEIAKKEYRGKVLGHGLPVAVGGGTASVFTEPSACVNPPTELCSKGEFMAIKGNWAIQAYLDDMPPTIPGVPELALAAAEEQIKQLEEQIVKPRLTVIGQVAAGSV